MITSNKTKGRLLVLALAIAMLSLVLAGCQPSQDAGSTAPQKTSNDTSVEGTLELYDPAVEAEVTDGKAIEGSEEEELQQERIAGGSVGAVTSKNLESLDGITDGSEGDYAASTGLNDQAPEMSHRDNGSDCLSCHKVGGSGSQQPKTHIDSNLTNDQCSSCHAAMAK